ncbi:MAG: HlyD family efflux transporter periplasmic adaptor subunit [Defluviitaleaceae bacterium]|nr:HlyD family efflux transporter periplasmic adaptor subunit [Defluviitaleaceae bacterium]
MKNITVNMKDISLHKEVYDTRPNKFFAYFIYGLFAMIAIALAWSYFGYIDIVVRASGIIRPHTFSAQIINATPGEVREVNFYEGMQVSQGDILYIIDTFHLENEQNMLKERLSILQFELESLHRFRDSLESGYNLIGNFNEELSFRFDNHLLAQRALEHSFAAADTILQTELSDMQETLSNAILELNMIRLFDDSITNEENLFASYPIESITNQRHIELFNIFRNQYLSYVADMENHRFQYNNLRESLDGYITIRDSAIAGYSLFDPNLNSIYRSIFEDYNFALLQLTETYNLASLDYSRVTILYGIGAIALSEYQAIQNAHEIALFNKEDHTRSFLINIENEIRNTENAIVSRSSQMELFHLNTVVGIGSQILQLERTIEDLNQRISQGGLQQIVAFFYGGELGEISMSRLGELNMTLNSISHLEQEILAIETTLTGLSVQIEDATVRAGIDGEINMLLEIVPGSFLMSGVNVLTILPARDYVLTANVFVSNNDIARIEEGMVIQYDIPAMPRRDFGTITGYVTRIATDVTLDAGLAGYFLIESELEDRVYYDNRGNSYVLRVGMGFDSRIIVDRQRILFFLLDQINLMFR